MATSKTNPRSSSTRAARMNRDEKTRKGLANNRKNEGNRRILPILMDAESKDDAVVRGLSKPKRSTNNKGSAAKRGKTAASRSQTSKSAAAKGATSSKAKPTRTTSKPARKSTGAKGARRK